MAEFMKKTYYFKLEGNKVYYFKVDKFVFDEKTDFLFLTYLPKDLSLPMTTALLEKFIQNQMREHGVTYHDMSDDEIEKVKLLYEQ